MSNIRCRLRHSIVSKVGFDHRIRDHAVSICFLIFASFGCGYPERPRVVTISSSQSFRPSSPREVKSVEQALAAIVTVCRDDLKLPLVKSFEANLYKNSQSFATFGVDWRMFPIDVADMAAFANGSKIHVDLQKVNDSGWAAITWLLAHEYGHSIQYEALGFLLRTDYWFNEGFAEWLAAKTFDALGWQDYRHVIDRVMKETSRLEPLPRLADVQDIQAWRRTRGFTRGRIRTYSLALLAFDRLIQKQGPVSAIQLVSSNFLSGFLGKFYEEFDQELPSYLAGQRRQSKDDDIVNPPRWNAGDKWSYELRRPGQKTVTERQFVRKDFFVGIPSYVVKTGAAESFYSIDSLALVATKKDGQYNYRVSNIDQVVSWPLGANKEWRNNFTRENIEVGATRSASLLMRVVGFENVDVRAGILRTVKIEAYGYRSGQLFAEYWYSPEAKWFAKSRIYDRDFSLVEEELVSFKVQ